MTRTADGCGTVKAVFHPALLADIPPQDNQERCQARRTDQPDLRASHLSRRVAASGPRIYGRKAGRPDGGVPPAPNNWVWPDSQAPAHFDRGRTGPEGFAGTWADLVRAQGRSLPQSV